MKRDPLANIDFRYFRLYFRSLGSLYRFAGLPGTKMI